MTVRAFQRIIRQRSTLPHSLPCSTIDAKELNFRVRDGYGCDLFAIATELNRVGSRTFERVCTGVHKILCCRYIKYARKKALKLVLEKSG